LAILQLAGLAAPAGTSALIIVHIGILHLDLGMVKLALIVAGGLLVAVLL
jgi:hypothetical protein